MLGDDFSKSAFTVRFAEGELALVNVANFVDADSVAVSMVGQPLSVVLATGGDFLAWSTALAIFPAAIVDVVLSIAAVGAVTMLFVVLPLPTVSEV
jgi:hypothetical protein